MAQKAAVTRPTKKRPMGACLAQPTPRGNGRQQKVQNKLPRPPHFFIA